MYKNILFACCLLFSTQSIADRGFDVVLKEMEQENRVALVIGNNTYQRPLTVLSNTTNDSKAIRDILANRGFDVIYRENVSHRSFNAVLEKFYEKLSQGGVGLLYFSGHGLEFDGQNYLIPTDAKIRAKSDTQYEAVALNKIIQRIKKIGNRLNIVILDACRNDPFAKAYGVGGLAKSEPIGLFVSYATGAGQVSSDGRVGGNGLFTQYLIENMKKPLSLQEVFKKTRASVYDASKGTQFPAIYDQIVKGDFYFTLPNKPISPKPEPVRVEPKPVVLDTSSKWISLTTKAVPWQTAKDLCRDNGARLPTIKELEKVVTDCGGTFTDNFFGDDSTENKKNNRYQECYKKKGFNSDIYWSSTSNVENINHTWIVYFNNAISVYGNKNHEGYFLCIKEGE